MYKYKILSIIYPILFRIMHFRRFRARYCRFGPSQIKLGQKSMIASGSIIKMIQGAKLDIGEDCYIGEYANIRCDQQITIGNNVHIGQFVTLTDADYTFGGQINFSSRNVSKILIGRNSFIGSHCCILRGSELSQDSVIPALTKVTR